MFEIIKPCQSCKSYVLKPKENVQFNLKDLAENIGNLQFEILAFTGSMLSLKKKCKINIYNSGKITIISKDLNQVHEIARELENVIGIEKI